jgi:hypothetical protein
METEISGKIAWPVQNEIVKLLLSSEKRGYWGANHGAKNRRIAAMLHSV